MYTSSRYVPALTKITQRRSADVDCGAALIAFCTVRYCPLPSAATIASGRSTCAAPVQTNAARTMRTEVLPTDLASRGTEVRSSSVPIVVRSVETPSVPSERQADAELQISRVVAVGVDDAEEAIGRLRIDTRIPQHRVVQRVDPLEAHLQLHFMRQPEVLVEPHVEQVQIVAADVRQRRGEIAHVVVEVDARVGALFHGIVHAVGLHRCVVEVEALRVPAGDVEARDATVHLLTDVRDERARIAAAGIPVDVV